MRTVWPEYLKRDSKIDVLVFAVDSSDSDRLNAATQGEAPLVACCFALHFLCSLFLYSSFFKKILAELENCLKLLGHNKPVMILGCKFDLYRAYSAYQLCEKMHLRDMFARHESSAKRGQRSLWCCQSISNVTGKGIVEALEW